MRYAAEGQLPDGLDVVVHFDGELSREQKAALLEVAGESGCAEANEWKSISPPSASYSDDNA